jgi:hypothetical protein
MAGSKKGTVTVVYNGIEKTIEFQPNQEIKALLEHALNEFGVQANRHIMSLFTEESVELDDLQSVKDAGVKAGDTLILRPSAVKGGLR